MEIPFPSKAFFQLLAKWLKENLRLWLMVLHNPSAAVVPPDSDKMVAMSSAFSFLAFVYLIVLVIVLPEMTIFYGINVKDPLVILVDFISVILLMVFLGALLFFFGRVLGGKGSFFRVFVSAIYLVAFWPIVQMTDYLIVANDSIREYYVSGKEIQAADMSIADAVIMGGTVVLLLVFGLFLVIKTVPMVKELHSIGTFRAAIVTVLTYTSCLGLGNLFMVPILRGLIDFSNR